MTRPPIRDVILQGPLLTLEYGTNINTARQPPILLIKSLNPKPFFLSVDRFII